MFIILFLFVGCCTSECRFIREANWRDCIVQQPVLNMKYQSNRGNNSASVTKDLTWHLYLSQDLVPRMINWGDITRTREADANKRNGDRFVEAYHTASPVSLAVTRVFRPPAFTLRRMFLPSLFSIASFWCLYGTSFVLSNSSALYYIRRRPPSLTGIYVQYVQLDWKCWFVLKTFESPLFTFIILLFLLLIFSASHPLFLLSWWFQLF